LALTQCPECQKEISTAAAACPHCGAPGPKAVAKRQSRSAFGKFILVVVLLGFFGCVAFFVSTAVNPPEQTRSITGIGIGVGCGQGTVDMLDELNRQVSSRGGTRRVENVYCTGDGRPKRVWLTGSIPWEPEEGTGRLAAKLLLR
jgi:hypothetical protein